MIEHITKDIVIDDFDSKEFAAVINIESCLMHAIQKELESNEERAIECLNSAIKEWERECLDRHKVFEDEIIQSIIDELKSGKISDFSYDDLVFYLTALGYDIEVKINKKENLVS